MPRPPLTRRRCLALGAAAAVLSILPPAPGRPHAVPVVAAAADLQFALQEVADLFQHETGRAVRLSFGSSGNIRRQIAQGAPFEMFLSADEDYALALAREGHALGEGTLYAVGRIVIVAPHGSPLAVDGELRGLAAALAAGRVTRFAVANPEHAPYGRAAREALTRAGLWRAIRDRLVLGENVSQAAQFALSGSAQGGIIAYSLALSPQLAGRATFALIPADRHEPLRQRMVLLRGAGETATGFYAFVQTPPAREILRRYGFALPGEGA